METEVKIAIAEDQALFRKGMIALLNSFDSMSVIVEAENGVDILQQLSDIKNSSDRLPDVVILDLRMPEMDGIKATEELRRQYEDIKIIVISAHDDADIIVHLYDKGVNAFLDKNAEPEEVELAIRNVLKNDFYFNEDAKAALEDVRVDKHSFSFHPCETITNRELQTLRLICQEKTAQEISEVLEISKRTVDNNRNRQHQKTSSKNITGLVLFAVRNNLINVSELKIRY